MREFEKKIAKEAKKNPKAFYNYVNSRAKSRAGIAISIKENGDKAEKILDKAEVLNDFLCSVFTTEGDDETPDC